MKGKQDINCDVSTFRAREVVQTLSYASAREIGTLRPIPTTVLPKRGRQLDERLVVNVIKREWPCLGDEVREALLSHTLKNQR